MMKKIATITFHWATNYGAVLQSYALQKTIDRLGFENEIIDYVPARVDLLQKIFKFIKRDFEFFKKERKIKKFRRQELIISRTRYKTNKSLFSCSDKYLTIITGSDQIWNPSFTMNAEGGPTLSYYLNFVNETKRVSYATSFGATVLDEDMKATILPELKRFSAISVREKTAQDILADMGVVSKIVLDPTLLLEKEDYESLCEKAENISAKKVFYYALKNGDCEINAIYDYICKYFAEQPEFADGYGVYEWLSKIRESDFVVTNSFHGTVFAILFHKPFVSVKIKGSGMNDRLTTLLGELGIEERFCENVDETKKCMDKDIDWECVDKKLEHLRHFSLEFLRGVLSDET